MATHVANVGIMLINALGQVISRGSNISTVSGSTSYELRVLYDATYAPNAINNPTIDDYLALENADGYFIRYFGNNYIVTFNDIVPPPQIVYTPPTPAQNIRIASIDDLPSIMTVDDTSTIFEWEYCVEIEPATPSGAYNCSWYISDGELPVGITMDPNTGRLTGTPTIEEYSQETSITATNISGSDTVTIGWNVSRSPTISYAGSPFTWLLWDIISANVTSNGATVESYVVQSGSLPAGVSLNSSTGQLTGTVMGIGSPSVTIRATSPNGTIDDTTIIINILTLDLPAGAWHWNPNVNVQTGSYSAATNGDAVSRWTDINQSVNANQASLAAQGTYLTDIDGAGHPGLRFDSFNSLYAIIAQAQPFAIFIVCKEAGTVEMFANTNLSSGATGSGSFDLWVFYFNGASSWIRKNGVQEAAGAAGAAGIANGFGIGSPNARNAVVDVMDIIIYPGDPSTDLADIESYLTTIREL